jgi:ubiquitin carboxyl-terminal hydrolase 7
MLHGIDASLDNLVAEELLEGDNAYEAERHGKQRARKGLRLKQLPPVLWLDLKRCELDLASMNVSKSSARFEFPERLDLTRYATGSCTYALHTVVVHEGDASNGHCHVHVRPDTRDAWLRIDNTHVLPSSNYAAL